MKPLDFPLLADESIAADVVASLVEQGRDIRSVHDEGLSGAPGVAVLRRATEQGRVVLTHDSDFGRLVFQSGEAFVGVIYLRPGQIATSFVLEIVATIAGRDDDVEPRSFSCPSGAPTLFEFGFDAAHRENDALAHPSNAHTAWSANAGLRRG